MINMKKVLSALTILAVSGTVASTTVACGDKPAKTTVIDLKTVTIEVECKAAKPDDVQAKEAEEAQATIKQVVQSKLDAIVKGAVLDTDYTLDLTGIVAGDLSAGVKVKIAAVEKSKIVTGENEVSVTFIKA